MPADWETTELWRKQIERRLYEWGAAVKGAELVQADRISDVVEQIQSLRKEVEAVTERMDKMAEWARTHTKKENGGTT